jgi:hypothetical protein
MVLKFVEQQMTTYIRSFTIFSGDELLQKIIELSSPTSNAITNSNEERIG